MVQEPVVSSHYIGQEGEKYAQFYQADTNLPGYKWDMRYFEPYLKPSDAVLDFGCGNGGMLRLVKEKVQRADGLEVNPAAARIARESGALIYGSLNELPEEPVYDVVMSNHVLEHVRDVSTTLERVRRCIKPGGCLVVKLPIDDFRAKKQRIVTRGDVDHHLQTWSPRLFANVLYETGFDVSEARIITSAWHPKLFPLIKLGIAPLAFWATAVALRRRQLFAVAVVPAQ